VAEHVGIDISMLSKIEHGERQLQSHMIAPIADFFEIDYKSIQIQFINQKILQEFGDEPYLNEALQILATTNK
jgi:transcriptional regulator with XRE-family HTH domain